MIEWFLDNLWAAFVLLIGYIFKQKDSAFKELDTKVSEQDKHIAKLYTQQEVYKEKLESLEKVIESKLENLQNDISEIKALLRRKR